MPDMPQNFALQKFDWRDENGDKLECTEKLRLLRENERELTQMTQDIFEDGIAMGVSKQNMNEAMKKLLLHLATSFSLLTFFLSSHAMAQEAPPASPLGQTASAASPANSANAAATDATATPTPATPTLPMRATPQTPPILIPAPVLYPANSWEGRSIGVIRILDRVTSETKELEIPVGQTITFHRLTLQLYACNQKPAGLPADAAIRLGLSEIPLKTDESSAAPLQRQFEGWFLAAEPAANIYPSPLYNIQAIRCAGDPVSPTLPPLESAKAETQPMPTTPVQVPETPATPPETTLQMPVNSGAKQDSAALPAMSAPTPLTAANLPFSSNNSSNTPAEKTKKKKHKHHRHEKIATQTETGQPSVTNASNGNIPT